MHTSAETLSHRSTRIRTRVAQIILTLVFALCALIATSTLFVPDSFEPAAVVLIASFGCLASALGIAATWNAPASVGARLSLWALPLFFVWHVAALGTWLPDAVFAAIAVVCILLLTTPRSRVN